MLNAVPSRYTAAELDLGPRAECELCHTRDAERDWVLCPLVHGRPICYGCCLDLQGLARSGDFDTNPFRGLFDDLARKTGSTAGALRLRCLEHQEAIVAEQLRDPEPADERDELTELAEWIGEAIVEART